MRLVHKDTGKEVFVGEKLVSFRGDVYYAHYWRENATKICVRKDMSNMLTSQEFFISVFNLEWI